jgi:hypothetical protein
MATSVSRTAERRAARRRIVGIFGPTDSWLASERRHHAYYALTGAERGDRDLEWSEGEGGRPPKVGMPGSGNRVVRK